jgi:osmotically-inducible protein OsmY
MCFALFPVMHQTQHDNPTEEPGNDEARLHEQIREQLKHHARIDATKIGIVVRKSQVLLWGSVASEFERTAAGDVAASVAGRRNVINHIHVFQT